MAEETSYTDPVDGYINNGVVHVIYKSEGTEEYPNTFNYTNTFNLLTCNTCAAAVLSENAVLHTEWHNQAGQS
jgi:hypothetical protein